MFKRTWHILLVALADWINRRQQEVIEYLKQENRILRAKLGPGSIQLTVAEKRRPATAASKVGLRLRWDFGAFYARE